LKSFYNRTAVTFSSFFEMLGLERLKKVAVPTWQEDGGIGPFLRTLLVISHARVGLALRGDG